MENKGFTTIELILTIVLVMIIMATITNVTYTYRDRSEYEALQTEVINYKNTMTKIIYDDILDVSNRVVRINKVDDTTYQFITINNNIHLLTIENTATRMGISYDSTFYKLPEKDISLVNFEGIDYYQDDVNGFYSLDIVFSHRNLEDNFRIHLAIS